MAKCALVPLPAPPLKIKCAQPPGRTAPSTSTLTPARLNASTCINPSHLRRRFSLHLTPLTFPYSNHGVPCRCTRRGALSSFPPATTPAASLTPAPSPSSAYAGRPRVRTKVAERSTLLGFLLFPVGGHVGMVLLHTLRYPGTTSDRYWCYILGCVPGYSTSIYAYPTQITVGTSQGCAKTSNIMVLSWSCAAHILTFRRERECAGIDHTGGGDGRGGVE